MATASNSKLLRVITKASPRGATDFADAITAAIVVAGTAAAGQVLPRLAASLRHVLDQRAELAGQVEKIVDAHPLAEVLTSMPGFGVRTAVRILLDVSDASQFLTADTSPPPASETSSQPAPGTSTSNEPCSCPHSPRCAPTPSHDRKTGPGQETNTTPHSSACPAAAATSCSPCSATRRPTARPPLSRLDEALSVAASAGVVCTDEYFLHPDPYPTRED